MKESDRSSFGALTPEERAGLERAVRMSREEARTRWVARVVSTPIPDVVECYARTKSRDRFLWHCGAVDSQALAFGIADETESAGPGRFEDIRGWATSVRERIDWIGQSRPNDAPTFFGGFGFEEESRGAEDWKAFPAARFVLPNMVLEDRADGSGFVSFTRIEPGATADSVEAELVSRSLEFEALCEDAPEEPVEIASSDELAGLWGDGPEFRVKADRPHAIFRAQVEAALEAIGSQQLTKVVLARALSVDHDGDFDVPEFLARLRLLYPTCTLIAVGRGDDTFLAATPETLVRKRGRAVQTAALAGSAPRGRNPEEDREFGRALLSSKKERNEHALVVDAIRDVLAARCETLTVPVSPSLRALFGIQHLETPISGELRAMSASDGDSDGTVDVLQLISDLHPTPAVGGVPRREAGAWLRQHEGLDRGWYAAPVGWLDIEGGGDFRVALRSGLIRNRLDGQNRAGASRGLLFAGAGLVEGSVADEELRETRIKLRALLAPLTEI